MKYLKVNLEIGKPHPEFLHRANSVLIRMMLFLLGLGLLGCSDFIEVDPPKNIMVSKTVFNDPSTVDSALANIYYKMREEGMVSGNYGFTILLGAYSDELEYHGFISDYSQLYLHNHNATNGLVLDWWSQGYNLIYSANDILKGVGNSKVMTSGEKDRFTGQALFVRAYVHSLLASIFGDIPYVATTDYLGNNVVSRMPETEVYEKIIADLKDAVIKMEGQDLGSSERVFPDQWVARALLSRMYQYTEKWELAASTATELIDAFVLEPDLDEVFLKGSSETIWQLKSGVNPRNTQEANQLVIRGIPGQTFALTESLLAAFEPGDQRTNHWVGNISNSDNTITLSFAHKYKAIFLETESLEYSILFRLAEQYLIRAEARAQMGELDTAREDLNTIRSRAGLPNSTANTSPELLDAILQERRVELFAEQGLRWFDLKRTGLAEAVMEPLKQNWRPTDLLLPIPENELETNPNLLPQNDGY